MRYFVRVQPQAQADADRILDWLAPQSPAGAQRWRAAFRLAAASLSNDPTRFALAPECKKLGTEVRQRLFKTRRGGSYRLLFMIVDDEVHVVRVRGPGQRPIHRGEIEP